MKFYTWCNKKDDDRLKRLIDSAKFQNINVEVIGEGKDIDEGGKFNGKNLWLYEKVCELPDDEIVVCTDAFDVIYLANADEIKQKFLEMNAPVVYSGACGLTHQDEEYFEYYTNLGGEKHYKYLNSGALIGYSKNIKEKFGTIFNYNHKDAHPGVTYNQGFIGKYIAENPEKAILDYECEIFWTDINFCPKCPKKHSHPKHIIRAIDKLKNEIVVNDRMYNLLTSTYPCIYHCPNIKKTDEVISTAWDLIRKAK